MGKKIAESALTELFPGVLMRDSREGLLYTVACADPQPVCDLIQTFSKSFSCDVSMSVSWEMLSTILVIFSGYSLGLPSSPGGGMMGSGGASEVAAALESAEYHLSDRRHLSREKRVVLVL